LIVENDVNKYDFDVTTVTFGGIRPHRSIALLHTRLTDDNDDDDDDDTVFVAASGVLNKTVIFVPILDLTADTYAFYRTLLRIKIKQLQ
jgi:hypothetical protein